MVGARRNRGKVLPGSTVVATVVVDVEVIVHVIW